MTKDKPPLYQVGVLETLLPLPRHAALRPTGLAVLAAVEQACGAARLGSLTASISSRKRMRVQYLTMQSLTTRGAPPLHIAPHQMVRHYVTHH